MTNRERAIAARAALEVFTIDTYGGTPEELGAPSIDEGIAGNGTIEDDCDAQTMVLDLICDLGHYCRAVGLDYEQMIASAESHNAVETTFGWENES